MIHKDASERSNLTRGEKETGKKKYKSNMYNV